MRYAAHNEIYKGYTIKILSDEDPMNPYEDWDNFGTIIHWHRRGWFGEDYSRRQDEVPELLKEIKKGGGEYLPIFLYEHGGQTISTGAFSCPWDSGQVGYIYVTADKIRENFGVKRITKSIRERAVKLLEAEIETLDDYLTGNVYGFVVEKGEEEIASCWGFFGDYEKSGCLEEARSHADYEERVKLPLLAEAGLLT